MKVVKTQDKVNTEQGKSSRKQFKGHLGLRTNVSFMIPSHIARFCERLHSVADSLLVLHVEKTSVGRSKAREKTMLWPRRTPCQIY
jgi:hypothetical protein